MDAIEIFKRDHMNYCIERENKADALRKRFVADYPVDSIMDISQDEFLLGLVNENTFCNRLRYDMQVLASMGDAFPATFGIYYKKGYGIKLNKTFEKIYGNNIEKAFWAIKNEIVRIMKLVENDD